MIRFMKPDGSPFDFDYEGPIHAFDSGNDLIAICPGKIILDCELEDDDDEDEIALIGDPRCWDDWEIVVSTDNEYSETMLMQALASAYSSLSLADRLLGAVCTGESE